jgi:hypothetical protein
MLVCAFYELKYHSYLAVMLPKFFEKFLYLMPGQLNQFVKNNCSLTSSLVIASLNPSLLGWFTLY